MDGMVGIDRCWRKFCAMERLGRNSHSLAEVLNLALT